jgi:hypothetical protein
MQIPDNIKKRVNEDSITIEGRTFKLHRFDPLLGNYILVQLFTMTLPFGIGDMIKGAIGKGTEKLPASTDSKPMGKAEFLEMQRDILSHCTEVLPAGEAPVVRDNGTYGITDFTMGIAMQLLISTIAFNFNDFFGDVLSESGSTEE